MAIVVVVGSLTALVIGNRGDLPSAWRVLRHADGRWLAAMAVVIVVAAANVAMFDAAAQRAAGLDTGRFELLEASTVGHFLNRVTKSGGLAGLAPLTAQARRAGRSVPAATAAYLLVVVVGQWTFAATLLAGLVVMWADGRLTAGEVTASLVFALVLVAQLAAVVAATRGSAALVRLQALAARWRRRMTRRPSTPPTADTAATAPTSTEEFRAAMRIIRGNPRRCIPVVVHGFVVELCGITELAIALAAVGEGRRLVPALVAYAVGVLFSIVGFLPAGIGFVEVSTTAALASFGIGVGPAAAAVLLFRVAELWVPVAAGGVLALRLRRAGAAAR